LPIELSRIEDRRRRGGEVSLPPESRAELENGIDSPLTGCSIRVPSARGESPSISYVGHQRFEFPSLRSSALRNDRPWPRGSAPDGTRDSARAAFWMQRAQQLSNPHSQVDKGFLEGAPPPQLTNKPAPLVGELGGGLSTLAPPLRLLRDMGGIDVVPRQLPPPPMAGMGPPVDATMGATPPDRQPLGSVSVPVQNMFSVSGGNCALPQANMLHMQMGPASTAAGSCSVPVDRGIPINVGSFVAPVRQKMQANSGSLRAPAGQTFHTNIGSFMAPTARAILVNAVPLSAPGSLRAPATQAFHTNVGSFRAPAGQAMPSNAGSFSAPSGQTMQCNIGSLRAPGGQTMHANSFSRVHRSASVPPPSGPRLRQSASIVGSLCSTPRVHVPSTPPMTPRPAPASHFTATAVVPPNPYATKLQMPANSMTPVVGTPHTPSWSLGVLTPRVPPPIAGLSLSHSTDCVGIGPVGAWSPPLFVESTGFWHLGVGRTRCGKLPPPPGLPSPESFAQECVSMAKGANRLAAVRGAADGRTSAGVTMAGGFRQ